MQGKGEKAGTGAKGGLCRAEGAEVPYCHWDWKVSSVLVVLSGKRFFGWGLCSIKTCLFGLPYDLSVRRVGRSESL